MIAASIVGCVVIALVLAYTFAAIERRRRNEAALRRIQERLDRGSAAARDNKKGSADV